MGGRLFPLSGYKDTLQGSIYRHPEGGEAYAYTFALPEERERVCID
jgi:hypothetical protein